MIFEDREDAGRRLAKELAEFANRQGCSFWEYREAGSLLRLKSHAPLQAPMDVFLSHNWGSRAGRASLRCDRGWRRPASGATIIQSEGIAPERSNASPRR